MYRSPSSTRRPTGPWLVSVAALILLALGGCYTNDSVGPDSDPPAPLLVAEPPFSSGLSNTVSWTWDGAPPRGAEGWEFLVQRSGDADFLTNIDESGWIQDQSYEFTGLEHGSTHHYRVRGRNLRGEESAWSADRSSTQDAAPPSAATLAELKDEQTSLLFTFELAASDELSGIREIELWFGLEGEEPSHYGTFAPGEVSFQATQSGIHELTPIAVDGAGNRQDTGQNLVFATTVPEPVIITDRNHEDFDITYAVLELGMGVQYFEFGLGRYSIPPIIDPVMLSAGEFGFPDQDNLVEVVAVNYGDDNRAYKVHDMNSREVIDDVVNGIPIAVCY